MTVGAYTSIPDVIDYLVTTIRNLPACADPVVVTDGWAGTYQPQSMVCIGGGPDDDEHSSVRDYAVLGNGPRNLEESYEIPIYVRCFQGGTDLKPARDAAFTIYKAIEAAIRADTNLGGNITAPVPARISALDIKPTVPAANTRGRAVELRCAVAVRHRY
jgi:hypothetical protein